MCPNLHLQLLENLYYSNSPIYRASWEKAKIKLVSSIKNQSRQKNAYNRNIKPKSHFIFSLSYSFGWNPRPPASRPLKMVSLFPNFNKFIQQISIQRILLYWKIINNFALAFCTFSCSLYTSYSTPTKH